MSYLWENYSIDKKYRIGERISPYIEVLNSRTDPVDVNPLIRFSRIFDASFQDASGAVFAFDALSKNLSKEGVDQIVDVLFHYLAQLDRTKGLDSGQRIIEKLCDEIKRGMWGKNTNDWLEAMTEVDRESILYVLSRRVLVDRQSFFMEAVGKTFPFSSLCFEKETAIYYLYVGSEETEYNRQKLDLIKTLFWTVDWKLIVVWYCHYGIIGCDETMRIGNIQITSDKT